MNPFTDSSLKTVADAVSLILKEDATMVPPFPEAPATKDPDPNKQVSSEVQPQALAGDKALELDEIMFPAGRFALDYATSQLAKAQGLDINHGIELHHIWHGPNTGWRVNDALNKKGRNDLITLGARHIATVFSGGRLVPVEQEAVEESFYHPKNATPVPAKSGWEDWTPKQHRDEAASKFTGVHSAASFAGGEKPAYWHAGMAHNASAYAKETDNETDHFIARELHLNAANEYDKGDIHSSRVQHLAMARHHSRLGHLKEMSGLLIGEDDIEENVTPTNEVKSPDLQSYRFFLDLHHPTKGVSKKAFVTHEKPSEASAREAMSSFYKRHFPHHTIKNAQLNRTWHPSSPEQRAKARAKHWEKTGAGGAVPWMRDHGML